MSDPLEIFIAKQQNIMDYLTSKIYGSHVKFEHLSAFGQKVIEDMARDKDKIRPMNSKASRESELEEKITEILRENEDLWNENEELKLRLMELEPDAW